VAWRGHWLAALLMIAVPVRAKERSRKLAAIEEHRSQMAVMAPLMHAFARSN
jgi:hypothetical protein